MKVINFYSEDLKIDYLSLNLQFNNLSQIQKIADYLADTFGCKSTLLDQSTKLKKLDWAVFDLDSTNFGRIDLCYDRNLKSTDRDPHLFLENSYCDWLRCNFRGVRKLPSEEVLVNSLSASFLTEKPENDLVKVEFVYRLIQLINSIKSLKS